jgi:hypothetical protein
VFGDGRQVRCRGLGEATDGDEDAAAAGEFAREP